VDLRYHGQSFELTLPVATAPVDARAIADLEEAFGLEHERTYGHRAGPAEPVELVNLRVIADGVPARPRVPDRVRIDRPGDPLPNRRVYFGPHGGWLDTPVLRRLDLATPRSGPCIVEEYDATCLVPPHAQAAVDGLGNIVLRLGIGDPGGTGR
jgi:N-methylhydantoinase A